MASLVQAGNNGASIVDGAAVLFTNSLVAHRTAAEESVGGALESALTAADNEGCGAGGGECLPDSQPSEADEEENSRRRVSALAETPPPAVEAASRRQPTRADFEHIKLYETADRRSHAVCMQYVTLMAEREEEAARRAALSRTRQMLMGIVRQR